jgi:hypothetical protein
MPDQSHELSSTPMNANIPPMECFVRAEYMRQHKDSHGILLNALIFGVASLPGQVPLFHFQLEDGGIWWRMPISAFCHKKDAPATCLEELVLWDSFSYEVSVIKFDWLTNKRMEYISRSRTKRGGRYLFTLDWADSRGMGMAEQPGHHKCGHVIELDEGNYAIQPNNRLRSFDPAFTTRFGENIIDRLLSDRVYTAEQSPKWQLTSEETYDYEIRNSELVRQQSHTIPISPKNDC